jgi:hypothetical protein
MIEMKTHLTGLALAALITIGSALPGFAEDAAPPKEPMAQPPAAKTEAPPPSVPRPSLAPKTAEPAAVPDTAEPAQRPHRRYARHRHGYYRTAYWEPFPVFWPHYYHHHRVHWNRIPWLFRF